MSRNAGENEIVVVGSGHNGLVAAAYLAAAGRRVLVLERNAWFGGGVVTRELTLPGFRHDQHSMAHIFIHANPLLAADELGLKAQYGLQYVFPDPPMMSVFEDGTTLAIYRDRERTCAEIAKFSKKDADAYRRLAAQAAAWLPMVAASLYAAPAPQGASFAMLDQSPEGREFWKVVQMSTHDVLCEYFEHDKVRMHFARIAGENLVSPDEKATGLGVFVFVGFMEAYGIGVPIGGSGRLTDALIACIRNFGGEVLANVDVARVRTANGRATAVVTTDGSEYTARDAVIGAIHPHHLGQMVEGIDPAIAKAAAATQISPVACITVHGALKSALRFKAGEQVRAVMIELLPTGYDTLRRSFDDLRYGGFSQHPLIGLGSLTMFDASRVPEGRATMHVWDYVPFDRADGESWDETKRDYAERMLKHMGRFIENVGPDNILQFHCDSPLDMQRTSSSFQRGDLHGIATSSYQSGAHRPTPELGQFTVPGIERLYLVGPFQHPGGGVFGAGRATAVKLAEDLKIDLSKVAH
ncbi:MAG: phytoene desaturase family protein [Steroidobacterales bacterium]